VVPSGILLGNCSHIIVSNIEITGKGGNVETSKNYSKNMKCVIMVSASQVVNSQNIQIKDVSINDMLFED